LPHICLSMSSTVTGQLAIWLLQMADFKSFSDGYTNFANSSLASCAPLSWRLLKPSSFLETVPKNAAAT